MVLIHDILYNPIKSKCMAVVPTRYKLNLPIVTLNNINLVYENSVKYLGVVLDSKLKHDVDIARQLRSLHASFNSFISNFSRCSIPVKQKLIESYCFNFYCATIWVDYNKKSIAKIRVAYINIVRKVLGYARRDSASSMFVTNNIDGFEYRMRKMCFNFRERLTSSNNNIIMNVNDNMWIISNYMWRKWTDILYKGPFKWWSSCIVLLCFYTTPLFWSYFCLFCTTLLSSHIMYLSTMYCMNVIWVFLPEINFTNLLTNIRTPFLVGINTMIFEILGMLYSWLTSSKLLPRPRRGLRGIVFTRSVCLSVCVSVCLSVYLCVRPIFWYFISRLLEEISIWNLYRILIFRTTEQIFRTTEQTSQTTEQHHKLSHCQTC